MVKLTAMLDFQRDEVRADGQRKVTDGGGGGIGELMSDVASEAVKLCDDRERDNDGPSHALTREVIIKREKHACIDDENGTAGDNFESGW
jgi:hypothetical protein